MSEDSSFTHEPTYARTSNLSRILILFTRFPTPGLTKTRLIPALGAEGAADLQRQMTEHTLSVMGPLISE